MRGWFLAGALASAGLLVTAGLVLEPVQAQEGAGSARIAVVDVNKAFKGYDKFNALNGELKTAIEAKEGELREIEAKIRGKVQAAQSLANQADRDRVEKEVADLKFDFEKKRRDYQNEFLRRESDIYSTVYNELTDVVAAVSKHNGIHIVFRTKEDEETENPQAVLQTITRQVVYAHPNLDITEVVVTELNQRLK